MRIGQKLKASDGKEVLLFPLEYMYIIQDEGGSYSHSGTLNIDFLGWGNDGRIYQCPYYAPCTVKCVYANNSVRVWESINKVHTADGGLRKICFLVDHDDNPTSSVGDIVRQGELIGHTGNSGYSDTDHVHMNTCYGSYAGQELIDGNWQLINSSHIYDTMYVNDTFLVEAFNHNWKIFNSRKFKRDNARFKWVLYAKKIRER